LSSIPQFPLVVVDEYQDFNRLETSFIDLLATRSPVLIAGDDDQALYSFKGATPDFIRQLAIGKLYEVFSLPYCSRCPSVVVDAVNGLISHAQAKGLLQGRLAKKFECYMPEKASDSEKYPHIIHARCSVQNKVTPLIGRYVRDRIGEISEEDIAEAVDGGYPTALVIGPGHFTRPVFELLEASGVNVSLKQSNPTQVELADAYRLLAQDDESNLGWRIVTLLRPTVASDAAVARAIATLTSLPALLPDEYKSVHLSNVATVRGVLSGDQVDTEGLAGLATALGVNGGEIQEIFLGAAPKQEDPPPGATVICTTLVGSKGLSAGHVFIVGFNDHHIPAHSDALTDEDVCAFLVALSRTRKQCHLVSCGRFGGKRTEPSLFLRWLAPNAISTIEVNAKSLPS
jgi:superfamily I DNA/RNA helicase